MYRCVRALLFLFCALQIYCTEFVNGTDYINKHTIFGKQLTHIPISLAGKQLPDWMIANIHLEFQQVDPFTIEELEKTFDEMKEAVVHFRIRNGILYFRCNRPGIPYPISEYAVALLKLLREPTCHIKTGDFLLELWDTVEDRTAKLPILCFSKHRTSNYICVPDPFALGGDRPRVMQEVDRATAEIPWERKVGKAFWIGCPNGEFDTLEHWKSNSRAQLTLFSLDHPELLWARFTTLKDQAHICPEVSALEDLVSWKKRIPPFEACRHKYLVDVDGFGAAFHRCQWILRSTSALIKENSGRVQWFYSGLEPYVHYVPYQSDCSDLERVITWMREHDSEAKEIAVNGRDFSLNYLNPETTYLYLYQVLKKYNELLN